MCALTFLPNKESGSTLRWRASNPITANNLGFYAYKYIHTYIHTYILCLKIIF